MADPKREIEQDIKDLASITEVAFKNITSNIKQIFDDALSSGEKVISSLTKDMTRNINSLAKDSNNLIINQSRINKGLYTSKEVRKQILQNEDKLYRLEQQRASTIQAINDDSILSDQQKQDLIEDINREYEQSVHYNNEIVKTLQKQAQQLEVVEKRAGVTLKLFTGLKKIPILGDILNIDKGLENMRSKALDTNNTFKILGSGIKGAFEGIEKASIILGIIASLKKVFDFIKDAMFEADKRVTNIAKNFSISKDSARAQYEALQQTKGVLTTNLALTSNIVDAFNELSAISEFTYQASIGQLDTQIQLTKEIGIQAEEATQLQQLFMLNNNEADKGLDIVYDQIAAFANQNKIVADGRKVIADINKLSGLIKLNFRGNTGELVKTVLEAKKLGLTLDQITNTQSSLLDFESSISSQIEAELLTGRQINLERARLFALNNDIAGLTEEIAKQNITAASFSRMNAIQQESIAKTLGMNASTLGDTLYKQELINKAGGQELKNKRDYIALLKTQGKDSEAARLQQELTALEAGLIRGESLEDAQKSLDAQTKFTASLEQAKEIFTDLVDGGTLDKLSDIIKGLASALSKNGIFGLFNIGSETRKATSERQLAELEKEAKTNKELEKELNSLKERFAKSGITDRENFADRADILINRLSDKYIPTIDSSNKTATTEPKIVNAKDFVIKTLPEDTVVAAGGTRLGNTNELLKTQQETNMILKQLLTKNTNIYMDSNKVSTTISQNSFNVGQ